jgi:Arc/MetJ-type ribon-helix-helix transcriptional regulator
VKRIVDLERTHSSAAVAKAMRKQAVDRPKMRRPRPSPDPICKVTVTLEGQLVDVSAALKTLGGFRSRSAVIQAIVENGLWREYERSARLREHVATRAAGRAASKKTRQGVDDLYDSV